MSEELPRKTELVEIIKRKLKIVGDRNYYPAGLVDCEESYGCLMRLNTAMLIKINACLTLLAGK